MSHPLIPQITEIAQPIASSLSLEVVHIVFHTNQAPPTLRVDIRNCLQETGLEDCERMSRLLDEALDAADLIPGQYVLEISSPGLSRQLVSDRDFQSFHGFQVLVTTSEPFRGNREWQGKLAGRDDQTVSINQRGRTIVIPRSLVVQVQLVDAS